MEAEPLSSPDDKLSVFECAPFLWQTLCTVAWGRQAACLRVARRSCEDMGCVGIVLLPCAIAMPKEHCD
jgi:hypothetical protein